VIEELTECIRQEFPIEKERKRTYDTLLQCKCPLPGCRDYFRNDRKNRVRAAFIVKDDHIFYSCFNCSKSLSVSERFNSMAWLMSCYREIPYEAAKQLCFPISKWYVAGIQKEDVAERISESIKPVSVPGKSLTLKGIDWLRDRGFDDPAVFREFKQDDNFLFYPLTVRGKTFGYLKVGIDHKTYLLETGGNDLHSYLVGLDDVTKDTRLCVVVESLIDALLITQDSGCKIVGLTLLGRKIGDERLEILENLRVPFVLNVDSDQSGLNTIRSVEKHHPEWNACFFNGGIKDYGDYRKKYGSIAALQYLANDYCRIDSPRLKLMMIS